jgi:hypothetical protein
LPALSAWAFSRAIELSHDANAMAALRFTSILSPLRSLRMNSARSIAISTQAPEPRDSSRFRKWPMLRFIEAILRFCSSYSECHATQPRAISRLRK